MQNNTIKYLASILAIHLFALPGISCAGKEIQSETNSMSSSQIYTASIKNLANKAKSVVDSGISEFSENTLPHEAKDRRKQIVRLRDILDVFPHNFAHELKLWDDVRDGLDDGYTVVGEFKDLFDASPKAVRELEKGAQPEYKDKKKLNERRKKVLEWKADYLKEGGISEKIWALFLDIHALSEDNVQNSKKYSLFFWGGVLVQPSTNATPAQNARTLIDAQSDIATAEHPTVLDIKNPSTEKNEIIFHDHRKRLRTIAKICNVANALESESCNSEAVKDLELLVSRLGEIEDLIITGRHLEEDGKKEDADEAYEDAEKKFKKIKKEFAGQNMIEALERI